jgi:hypothetical protein
MDRLRELGKVKSVWLGVEDHGCLIFQIVFDFGGSQQAFGGYNLVDAEGADLLKSVIAFFGCEWSEIKGRTVYALRKLTNGFIIGLERPAFEGGDKFLIDDWKKKWKL